MVDIFVQHDQEWMSFSVLIFTLENPKIIYDMKAIDTTSQDQNIFHSKSRLCFRIQKK